MAVLMQAAWENDMYIVIGSAMVAVGLVAVSVLAWLFRSQRTPRWLGSDLAAMLLCIPVTALIGLGAGYVLLGLSHGVGLIETTALIGCAAVLLTVRWLIRRHLPAPAAVGAPGLEPPSGAP
jgi:heme A synthase